MFTHRKVLLHELLVAVCRAEEVIVTTDEDVTARVMQITDGKGAWASINPIGGEASRFLPSCKCCVNSCNSCMTALFTISLQSELRQVCCVNKQIAV